jgi:tape measure domain-containing protein
MDVSRLGIIVDSGGTITKVSKELSGLSTSAGNAERRVTKLTDSIGKLVSNMGKLAKDQMTASQAAATYIQHIEGGSSAMRSMTTSATATTKTLQQLQQQATKTGNAFGHAHHKGNILNNTLKSMMVAASAYISLNFAKGILEAGDAWAMMQAKLKLATGSMEDAIVAQNELFNMAQKYRAPLDDMSKLFVRLAPAMDRMGKSSQEAKDMVEGVSLALKLGGATAAEASSTMLQFSQAANAGRLNGAEFNAVSENGTLILRALEQSLGKTRGELKKMGSDGELTFDLINDAIQKQLPQWRKDFETLPITMEGAIQRIKNAWLRGIGELSQDTQLNQKLAESLRKLEEALPAIIEKIITAFNFLIDHGDKLAAVISGLIGMKFAHWVLEGAASLTTMWKAAQTASIVLPTVATGMKGMGVAAATATAGATGLRTALAFLGGPIGVVTGLVMAGVTAYQLWGGEAKKQSTETTNVVVAGTESRIKVIQKEIDKLNELRGVQTRPVGEHDQPSLSKDHLDLLKNISSLEKQINSAETSASAREGLKITLAQRQAQLQKLEAEEISIGLLKRARAEEEKLKQQLEVRKDFMKETATQAEKVTAKIAEWKEKLGESFTKGDEKRIRAMFSETKKASKDAAQAEKERLKGIRETIEASEKASLWIENMYEQHSKGVQEAINKVAEEAQGNEDLAATFGKTKAAIEQLEIARLEEQLAQRSSIGMTLQEIENLEKLISAKKRNATALKNLDELEGQKRLTEEAQREWENTVEKIDDVFREGFADMLNSGKSAWKSFTKSLATTFKTVVADEIYKTFFRKYVINFTTNMLGAFGIGGGAGNTLQAVNSGSNLLNTGSTLLNAGSTMAGVGSALYNGFSAGGMAGVGNVLGQMGTYASTALSGGTAAVSTGAMGTGWVSAEGAAAYGASAAGAGTGFMGSISSALSAIPAWGWVLAGALAFKDKLFGRKTVGSGLMGSIKDGDFTGSAYEFKKGGLFRSDKTVTTPLDAKSEAGFDEAVSGMQNTFNKLGEVTGAGANILKDFNYEFRLALRDFDEEGKKKEITRFMSSMSDSMAQAFVDTFRTSVDLGVQTASRYWTNTIDGQRNFTTGQIVSQTRQSTPLDPYIDDMIRIFDKFKEGIAGVEESEGKLTEFTVALFNLGSSLAANNGHIKVFGEALDFVKLESLANKGEEVTDTFTRLNTVFTATSAIAETLGRDASSAFGAIGFASLEARQRLIDLAGGIDALNSGTQSYIQSIYTQEQQMDLLKTQVMSAMTELGHGAITTKEELKNLVDGLDLASEADQKLYLKLTALAPAFGQLADYAATATQEAINKAKEATAQLESNVAEARNNLSEAYERESDALENTLKKFQDFSKSLRAFRSSLLVGNLSNLSPEAKYLELKSRFEKTSALAVTGDETALGELQGISEQFLEASKGYFASSEGYTRDFELVRAAIEQAANASDVEASLASQQLTLLSQSVSGLVTINQSVLSVREAIIALKSAQSASAGTGGPGGGSVINGVYHDALGNTAFSPSLPTNEDLVKTWYANNPNATNSPTTDAIQYWTDQLSRTDVSQYDVKQAFANSVASVTGTPSLDIKHFANGGNTEGWSWVGEQGKELAYFGDKAHVYTANQSKQMMSGSDDETKALLREAIVELRAANAQRGAATEAQLTAQRKLAEKMESQKRVLAANNAD